MNHPSPRASRRGITLFELLAAFSILSVVIPVSAGLLVRSGRLLVSARNQRIAIDELTNQLERLRSLAVPEPGAFVAGPEPSAFAAAHLPGVTLALTARARAVEFAVLRAVGASGRQILRGLLLEWVTVLVVGAALGRRRSSARTRARSSSSANGFGR